MTNLDFAERLVINRFPSSNQYSYSHTQKTSLRFYKDCPNYPFIMCSGWQDDPTLLTYSNFRSQLRGKLLNTPKIKEVMDTAHMPLLFSIKDKWYMIGKGFMSHIPNSNEFAESNKLLFVACIDKSKRTKRIEEVTFFVSRDIYKEEYKSVSAAIKDIMLAHPGDVILTSNIEDRIGDKITFPTKGSISDRQNYKKAVLTECINDYFFPNFV